jgi:hypothetical protein
VPTRRGKIAAARTVSPLVRACLRATFPALLATLALFTESAIAAGITPASSISCGGRVAKVQAAILKACLARGISIDFRGTTIPDELDLSGLGTVNTPFACRGCTFEKGFDASNVVFTRTVDLTGALVRGMRMPGALFEGAVLFSSTEKNTRTRFQGLVEIPLAVFDDIVSFEGALFTGDTDFSSTRFLGDALFSQATFLREADFNGAIFASHADFSSLAACGPGSTRTGTFNAEVRFERSSFRGTPDFRRRCFSEHASFARAGFEDTAEFTQAKFFGGATFANARFRAGARFRGAEFDEATSFESIAVSGRLDFTLATFLSQTQFFGLLSNDVVTFDDADFATNIRMQELVAAELHMDITATKLIVGDINRGRVLAMIETTAKERGDLDVANDAYFERRKLISKGYGTPTRVADFVFYRTLAGYFVRPLNPLLALAVFALAGALIRSSQRVRGQRSSLNTVHSSNNPAGAPSGLRQMREQARRDVAELWRYFQLVTSEYWRSIRRIVRGKQESDPAPQPTDVEILIYRALLAIALIGLANSSPTLREIVDAAL